MENDQCSELFFDVFDSHCGGCFRICECGITYFDGYNIYDWEEGELKELQQKANEDPHKYIEQDHSVSTMEIGGIQIVYGCSCDLAKKYERFILDHAVRLAEYLNKYAAALEEKAESIKIDETPQID